jgi:hypothetical protein
VSGAREEIDRTRVEALATDLFVAVRPILATPPASRENVLIVLNAIAFVAATVIAGTDADPEVVDFFATAVADNIEIIKAGGLH